MNMRAEHLRKFLVKVGFEPKLVEKTLDRVDLKSMAISYLEEQVKKEADAIFWAIAWKSALAGVVLTLVIVYFSTICKIFRELFEKLKSHNYRVIQNYSMFKMSLESGAKQASIWLAFATALEVIASYMQLCVFLGWVLSYESPVRLWFIPMLSIPANTNMLRGGGFNAQQHSNGFGLNLGPMLTMYLTHWMSGKCEALGVKSMDTLGQGAAVGGGEGAEKSKKKKSSKKSKFANGEPVVVEQEEDPTKSTADNVVPLLLRPEATLRVKTKSAVIDIDEKEEYGIDYDKFISKYGAEYSLNPDSMLNTDTAADGDADKAFSDCGSTEMEETVSAEEITAKGVEEKENAIEDDDIEEVGGYEEYVHKFMDRRLSEVEVMRPNLDDELLLSRDLVLNGETDFDN